MSNVPYLNVAGAMDRTVLWQPVFDATTGLPLEGATVMAYEGGTSLKARAVVGRESQWVALLNLGLGSIYTIKVSKRGYTAGAVDVYPGDFGGCWTPSGGCGLPPVGVPPKGRITAVLNSWTTWSGLDLYTWLPVVSSPGGVVGAGGSGHPSDLGPGDLSDFPYARWNRDGGFKDWLGLESISIAPHNATTPYYNLTTGDFYDFLATDYGTGDLNQNVFFRVWANGRIVPGSYMWKFAICDIDGADNIPGNGDDEVWWYAGYMQFNTFYSMDQCGQGNTGPGGVWPYSIHGGIQSIPERPTGK